MPIASGALDWPASYYSKPKGTSQLNGGQGGFDRRAWMRPGHGTETHDNFTGRHGNIPSQHEHYNKGHLNHTDVNLTKQSRKQKTKNRWKEKREDVKNAKEEKKRNRKRRRKCCCLAFWLAVVGLLLVALVLFLVFWLHPISDENEHDIDCKGQWRTHFLAYNATSKNSTKPIYVCCYHVNKQKWDDVIAKGDNWPQGYLINQTDCEEIGKCSDKFPEVECAVGNWCRPSVGLSVICLCVLAIMIYP